MSSVITFMTSLLQSNILPITCLYCDAFSKHCLWLKFSSWSDSCTGVWIVLQDHPPDRATSPSARRQRSCFLANSFWSPKSAADTVLFCFSNSRARSSAAWKWHSSSRNEQFTKFVKLREFGESDAGHSRNLEKIVKMFLHELEKKCDYTWKCSDSCASFSHPETIAGSLTWCPNINSDTCIHWHVYSLTCSEIPHSILPPHILSRTRYIIRAPVLYSLPPETAAGNALSFTIPLLSGSTGGAALHPAKARLQLRGESLCRATSARAHWTTSTHTLTSPRRDVW